MNNYKQAGSLISEYELDKSASDIAPVAGNDLNLSPGSHSRLRNADDDFEDGPKPLQFELFQARKDGVLYD